MYLFLTNHTGRLEGFEPSLFGSQANVLRLHYNHHQGKSMKTINLSCQYCKKISKKNYDTIKEAKNVDFYIFAVCLVLVSIR